MSTDLKDWMIVVGQMIKPYFTKQYTVKPHTLEMTINGLTYKIVRPNHGLAHGLRQSIIAVKIVPLLISAQPTHPMSQWLLQQDEDFIFKLGMVAAFQRTGRQSEIGHRDNPSLYQEYIRNDVKNFHHHAKRYVDNFRDDEEISFFQDALMWPLREELITLNYLETILSISHKADLRRILSFDQERILKMIRESLVGYPSWIVDAIWKLSGDHLKATGDRDMVAQRTYQPTFCFISTNPEEIVERLWVI
ncbi:Hypothetical protein POVR1_LOCUS131 [uncultured virus]|nr:Hypothetical protein POVR1_LOCUS131 [uncultured virus]